MATKSPRFRVKNDNSGNYYWIYYAANEEEIARSTESYVKKSSCLHSIALIKRDGPSATVFDWTNGTDAEGNYPLVPSSEIV